MNLVSGASLEVRRGTHRGCAGEEGWAFCAGCVWDGTAEVGGGAGADGGCCASSEVLQGLCGIEWALDRFKLVERRLKALAQVKVATLVGCPF